MSRLPSEPVEAPAALDASANRWPNRLRAARAGWRRDWLRARGQLPRHLLYVHGEGVVSWRLGHDMPPETSDTVADWCATHPDTDVRLRLSGELVHNLVVDTALGLRGTDAVRRYAQQQFTHYHGAQASSWPLAVWSDARQSGACAAHAIDLEAIRNGARRHGVHLRGIAPAWSAGLRSLGACRSEFAADGRHALLLVESGVATWLVAQAGCVVALSQRYLDPARPDAVAALMASLVAEVPPLAEPPIVIGWGSDPAVQPPADMARTPGPLVTALMADWLLDRIADIK